MTAMDEPSASRPRLRGTGRNPATSTHRTGPRQPEVTRTPNAGEAGLP
jgi:hypothetical protein